MNAKILGTIVFVLIPSLAFAQYRRRDVWRVSINRVLKSACVDRGWGAAPMAQTAMDPSRRPVANSMHTIRPRPRLSRLSLFAATPRCRTALKFRRLRSDRRPRPNR